MSNEINWEQIAKYLSGELSPDERMAVEEWLAESEENQKLLDSLKKVWNASDEKFDASDVKALWKNVAERSGINSDPSVAAVKDIRTVEKKYSKFSAVYNYPLFRYAALILLIASVVLIYFMISGTPWVDDWNSVIVKNGERETILLDDGSKIYADAGSRVHYSKNFGNVSRDVKLIGEAYFEVKHNPALPFKVYSGNGVVEVLGTKFNVRYWEESESIIVAVIEGRVSFGSAGHDNSVLLEKGYTAELNKNGSMSPAGIADTAKILSWLEGEIYFENTRLSEILARLERWYDVDFYLTNKSIQSEKLSVLIHNRSLKDNLDLLTRLTSTRYSIENKSVTLTPLK